MEPADAPNRFQPPLPSRPTINANASANSGSTVPIRQQPLLQKEQQESRIGSQQETGTVHQTSVIKKGKVDELIQGFSEFFSFTHIFHLCI